MTLALACLAAATVEAQTRRHAEQVAHIDSLLEASGMPFSSFATGGWVVNTRAGRTDNVSVLMFPDGDDLVLVSVLADHQELEGDARALHRLLKANAELPDNIVIMVDGDEDYVIQAKHPVTTLTADSFRSAVSTFAGAFDAVSSTVAAAIGARRGPTDVTFERPQEATREIDFLLGRAAVAFNPSLWKETTPPGTHRRMFRHVAGGGFALIIPETIKIRLDDLRQSVLQNARSVDPGAAIVDEQRRRVNGADVLLLRIEGDAAGTPFTYLGYYYGGEAGAVQIVTYTDRTLYQDYASDFEDFLNGFYVK